ncbi:MAG: hypothetical protein SVX38_07545 [Chloroflexota bacterium]|nr:hypothetical protein [Chloroflexota bacterium]
MVEFIQVATTEQVKPGTMFAVQVGGRKIVLYNVGGQLYATDAKNLACPCHLLSRSNPITGELLNPPTKYQVKVEGNQVMLGVDGSDAG